MLLYFKQFSCLCCRYGKLNVLHWLLWEARNKSGMPALERASNTTLALHYAAARGCLDCVRLLVDSSPELRYFLFMYKTTQKIENQTKEKRKLPEDNRSQLQFLQKKWLLPKKKREGMMYIAKKNSGFHTNQSKPICTFYGIALSNGSTLKCNLFQFSPRSSSYSRKH